MIDTFAYGRESLRLLTSRRPTSGYCDNSRRKYGRRSVSRRRNLVAVGAAPQEFRDLVGANERRALTPLFWSNINPNSYGRFRLDMNTHLDLTRERVGG